MNILSNNEVLALSKNWLLSVCKHDAKVVSNLYASDGILVGTVAQRIKQGPVDIKKYFDKFLANDQLCGRFISHYVQSYNGWAIHNGTYNFSWYEDGGLTTVTARFTFVWIKTPQGWRIATHHSSALPE